MNPTNFTTNAVLAGHFATRGGAHLAGFTKAAKKAAVETKLFSAILKRKEYQSAHFHSVCQQQRELSDVRQLTKTRSKISIRMSGGKWDIEDWRQQLQC